MTEDGGRKTEDDGSSSVFRPSSFVSALRSACAFCRNSAARLIALHRGADALSAER